MKRIFFKKNGAFHKFEDITGLQHPKPKDEADLKVIALTAFEVDDELEGFDIRDEADVPVFERSELLLTLNGFVEYGRVRWGLTDEQAEAIRKVIVDAKRFIVVDKREDGRTDYVAAPSGWARRSNGEVVKDGTDPNKSGPEMTSKRGEAFLFKTHRSAARQASKVPNSEVIEVERSR